MTAFGRSNACTSTTASFQTARFHAACKHEAIDIDVVHSKPYVSRAGCSERFNGTVKRQFENEVRGAMSCSPWMSSNSACRVARRALPQGRQLETNEAPGERFTGVDSVASSAGSVARR